MRIVMLSTDSGIRFGGSKGAAVHLAEVASALARSGATVLLLAAEFEPGAEPPAGGALEALPGPNRASAAERVAGQTILQRWLEDRLRRFNPDVLYERFALHSAAGAAAAARLDIPYLVELNAPLPVEAARYRTLDEPDAAHRLEAATLAAAHRVFAVSSPLAAYARDHGAACVEVMPNAVDINRFPERPPFEEGGSREAGRQPVAAFLGTPRPWHGIETIARAWEILGADAPGLLIIGDGPGRERLRAVGASTLGNVRHEAVAHLLARADIGLAPFAPDAPPYFSPLKLFEYLAAGLAVVVGALPGVREVVTPDAAMLIPPGDPVALAHAIRTLARDPARRYVMGQAGRTLVADHHTWDRRAARVIEVIADLGRTAGATSPDRIGLPA